MVASRGVQRVPRADAKAVGADCCGGAALDDASPASTARSIASASRSDGMLAAVVSEVAVAEPVKPGDGEHRVSAGRRHQGSRRRSSLIHSGRYSLKARVCVIPRRTGARLVRLGHERTLDEPSHFSDRSELSD